ncbi:MAG: hypothetical protein FGM46_10765, partial [Ferruginibacter sp.]|nr:hypothetical protein [Ferruginibacter sp.]
MKKKWWLPILIIVVKMSNIYGQKNSISITDFGAIPNDERYDNVNSFNAAISFANKNNIHIIRIPEGVFYVSKGINLNDGSKIIGAGMNKTILSLMSGLPPRDNEATQTAIFTGSRSYSLSHSAPTRNITIKSLTIDLKKNEKEFDISKFPMLGGIRLINPEDCLIDSVKII